MSIIDKINDALDHQSLSKDELKEIIKYLKDTVDFAFVSIEDERLKESLFRRISTLSTKVDDIIGSK